MRRRRREYIPIGLLAAAILCMVLAMTGCGQKGDLYIPDTAHQTGNNKTQK